jgi:hypothetical protein
MDIFMFLTIPSGNLVDSQLLYVVADSSQVFLAIVGWSFIATYAKFMPSVPDQFIGAYTVSRAGAMGGASGW